MMGQRRRRWTIIKSTSGRRLVFAGYLHHKDRMHRDLGITRIYTQWNEMNRALGHLCAHIG